MDTVVWHRWMMRGVYVFIATLILFFQLLPLDLQPSRWAGPDLLFAVTCVWAVRRAETVPVVLVAFVALMTDLILQRPPGLGAALTVLAVEWLKSRARRDRETTFVLEWLTFAAVLVILTTIYRVILMLVLVPPGDVLLSVSQVVMTVVLYPFIVILSRVLCGIRRSAPGDVDRLGRAV